MFSRCWVYNSNSMLNVCGIFLTLSIRRRKDKTTIADASFIQWIVIFGQILAMSLEMETVAKGQIASGVGRVFNKRIAFCSSSVRQTSIWFSPVLFKRKLRDWT